MIRNPIRLFALLAGASVLSAPVKAAEFEFTFDGVPEEARPSVQTAAAIIAPCLVSAVPIRIRVQWIERGPTGYAGQPHFRNLPMLPKRDVWYPSALVNAFAGERLEDQDDMNIFLSARTNWHFGESTDIAEDQTDFIGVVLHEIGHGLGLSSNTFTPWEGEPVTSLGFPNAYQNYFEYSFEREEQDGTPTLYDAMLRLADGRSLTDFANPSMALTLAIANPTLHFDGANAKAANRGFPVAVEPLSISHVPGLPRAPEPMMADASSQGKTRRENDPLALAMLADLGWTIAEECRSWDAPPG